MTKMTDGAKLAAAVALDRAYAEAESFDNEARDEKLDAYGHLTWTLGDNDWMVCFDAVRIGSEIAYHVVVNCESGGFIDTIERGVVRADEAEKLIGLPSSYVDAGMESHLYARQKRERVGRFSYRDCERRWARHIKQLMKQKTESEQDKI